MGWPSMSSRTAASDCVTAGPPRVRAAPSYTQAEVCFTNGAALLPLDCASRSRPGDRCFPRPGQGGHICARQFVLLGEDEDTDLLKGRTMQNSGPSILLSGHPITSLSQY